MLKKMLSILLVVLLINLAVLPSVYANDTKAEKDAKFTNFSFHFLSKFSLLFSLAIIRINGR